MSNETETFFDDHWRGRIRPSWLETRLIVRKPLTDAQIAKYQRQGYYSTAFREARRERMRRKLATRLKYGRDGNFVLVDGRMVYSPV